MVELKEEYGEDGKRKSPKLLPGIKNFLIDIDGVVSEDVPNEESERMKTAKVLPGAKEQVNKWYDQGNIITFFTSRTEDLKEITVNWLNENGFKFHNIIFGKPRGGNYHWIDNSEKIRATRFEGKFSDFVKKKVEIEVFEE